MRAHRRLVDLSAPPGAGGDLEVAVLDLRLDGYQLVVPGHGVDVDLHDAEVGDHGAEVRAHHGGQRAVEVVGRDVDLAGVGHGRDLQRLPKAVPGRVDDGHVHRGLLEVRPIVPPPEQTFAGGDRNAGARPDVVQGPGIAGVAFHPEDVEGL